MKVQSYLKGAAIIAVLLAAIIYALKALVWEELPIWLVSTPFFLLVLFSFSFRWLAKTEEVHPKRFVGVFMAATSLKMFSVVLGLVIYLMLDGPMRMHVALIAMSCYMVFMAHFAGIASQQIRKSSAK